MAARDGEPRNPRLHGATIRDKVAATILGGMSQSALKFVVLALALVLLAPQAGAAHHSPVSRHQLQLEVDRLQRWYDEETGLWNTEGWWNAANSLTILVDSSRLLHTARHREVINHTYSKYAPVQFLINKYYDDEGWWGLAWVDAYDLTGDRDYLKTAAVIFHDMTTGWDDTCGGGLWWTKDRKYKNAIANQLFLSLAAHLANRASDPAQRDEYAHWATREWAWFQNSGMIESDHLISDGLDGQCRDNHGRKWTYNQGVVLGALAELSRLPDQSGVVQLAEPIADAAIAKMADSSLILHETCEPQCGEDGTQFKGIFVRNLALLYLRDPNPDYARFIAANAESVLKNSQTPDHSLGLVWSGPPGATNAVSQTSAMDVLVAALSIRDQIAGEGP
jgi:predicted alpha-1,6-mannanase (GH76 family)